MRIAIALLAVAATAGAGCRKHDDDLAADTGGPAARVERCTLAPDRAHAASASAVLAGDADTSAEMAYVASVIAPAVKRAARRVRACGPDDGSVVARFAVDARGAITDASAIGIADADQLACTARALAAIELATPPKRTLAVACELTLGTPAPLRIVVGDSPVTRVTSAHVRLPTGMLELPLPATTALAADAFGAAGVPKLLLATTTTPVGALFAVAALAATQNRDVELGIDGPPAPPTLIGRWDPPASASSASSPKRTIVARIHADGVELAFADAAEAAAAPRVQRAPGPLREALMKLTPDPLADRTVSIYADATLEAQALVDVAVAVRQLGFEPYVAGALAP